MPHCSERALLSPRGVGVAGARRLLSASLVSAALIATFALAEGVAQTNQPGPSAAPNIHGLLMGKFDAMNHAGEGIFREDVTASLAPFFPVGQPIAQTRKVVAEQQLGALRPFMGTNDPGMGKMYVTRFDLVSHMAAHVYVVVDFDFEGAGDEARLKQMKAFLRSSNM